MATPQAALPRPGSLRLFVVAGFPVSTINAVKAGLQKAFPSANESFIAPAPSPETGTGRLYNSATIAALLKKTAEFAVRTRLSSEKKAEPPVPGRLVLLYAPAPDQEALLEAFDFFCMPWAISPPNDDDNWRLNPVSACDATVAAVSGLTPHLPVRELRRNSVQTLPPKNFLVNKSTSLADMFADIRRGKIGWTEVEGAVSAQKYDRSELPKIIKHRKMERFYFDERDLVFPPSNVGDHGPWRSIEENTDLKEILHLLRQMYRFGSALQSGFHHDVQRVGCSLKKESFFCSERSATVEVSDTHANIYPNDFVRSKKGG